MKELKQSDWPQYIKAGFRVFIGSAAACPHGLVKHFLEYVPQCHDLEILHGLTLGEMPWADEKYQDHLKINSFFLSPQSRDAVNQGLADYTPCYMSEIPRLFKSGIMPIDVALIQVTPPDQNGFCSFGLSVDVVKAACDSARFVIAQINPNMPRTFGQSFIHVSDIDASIEIADEIPTYSTPELTETDLKIGRYVSLLIKDGSTIQTGIGRIPEAVMHNLQNHSDLGIHSEMFTDGMLRLLKSGCISNKNKGMKDNRSITSFALGSKSLYKYINNNPHIEFHPSDYVNKPYNIARNSKMVAINSAIEVDLTGQVVADSVGHKFYSGIGGQVDFIRGAGMCEDGIPIIALPSTAKNGTISRIVHHIAEGAGVVTSRGDVHYVVTEYGIATLVGRSIQERALEMIQIAHPKFRDELLDQFKAQYKAISFQEQSPMSTAEFSGLKIKKLEGTNYMLRPLHSSDLKRIQEFFYSHQERTLLQRYRHVPTNMPVSRAYKLVNVDQSKDLALTIVERQGPREIIHAIGRYYLESDARAELAFVVNEEKHGQGMGSTLLTELIRIAEKRKLKTLVAYIRNDNAGMKALVELFHFSQIGLGEDNELTYELDLHQSQKRKLNIFLDKDCLLHESLDPHPEAPERLKKLYRGLEQLKSPKILLQPKNLYASYDDLCTVHDKDYLQSFESACLSGKSTFMSNDNYICFDSYDAARASAGLAISAAKKLLEGERSFVIGRPPGHHASANKSSGFCFFNNIALAAKKIIQEEPNAKVLIIDIDVHHGNGTEKVFYEDNQVFTLSLHADPKNVFPHTGLSNQIGKGKGAGYNLNVVLEEACDGKTWLFAFANALAEVRQRFEADYILVAAGYDAHKDDPMKLMCLTDDDYLKATSILQRKAEEYCDGKIAFFLEGGYSGDVLSRVLSKSFELLTS